jgi:GntR family transcriptional regulator, transcriptional repressor for pyruvate dehydrogenase complex
VQPVGVRRESQPSRIARELLKRISTDKYPVGSRLPSERPLMEDFSVSRPVVREALSMISALDVVDIQMGRGAFVIAAPEGTLDSLNQSVGLLDVVNVREVLEAGALQLAHRRGRDVGHPEVRAAMAELARAKKGGEDTSEPDVALHRAMVAAAGSPVLLSLWNGIESQIEATIRISPHGRRMSQELLSLHETMADGLLAGKLTEALDASAALYEDHRHFLRNLLGEG